MSRVCLATCYGTGGFVRLSLDGGGGSSSGDGWRQLKGGLWYRTHWLQKSTWALAQNPLHTT